MALTVLDVGGESARVETVVNLQENTQEMSVKVFWGIFTYKRNAKKPFVRHVFVRKNASEYFYI